ncbi:MAG: haloacid dehalogenase-like hydrolase [Mucilaginibacter polytrichastri]|nr:haloacid dehalogenase-like hydrolase [Mucilaginibacter polytrichastri]
MAKGLALFDLDGTITKSDTFIEFIRYTKGDIAFVAGFGILSPALIAMKLKMIPNWRAKEITLSWFFGGMPVDEFNRRCGAFSDARMDALVRPGAKKQIEWHKQQDHTVYIVSASAENWLKKWCAEQDIHLLATRLIVENGRITGKLDGRNCYGEEKVSRIKEAIRLEDYETIWAYGDSSGDKQMLALTQNATYKPFRT